MLLKRTGKTSIHSEVVKCFISSQLLKTNEHDKEYKEYLLKQKKIVAIRNINKNIETFIKEKKFIKDQLIILSKQLYAALKPSSKNPIKQAKAGSDLWNMFIGNKINRAKKYNVENIKFLKMAKMNESSRNITINWKTVNNKTMIPSNKVFTPSIASRLEAIPDIFAPMLTSILHSC